MQRRPLRAVYRGFSLVEMLVAFLLSVLAVLGMVSIFPMGLASIQQSGDSVQAQAIAQHYLDLLREYYQTEANPPDTFMPGQTIMVAPVPGATFAKLANQTQQIPTYSLSYTSTNLAAGGLLTTPEHYIVLTIRWTANGGTHARTYEEDVQN